MQSNLKMFPNTEDDTRIFCSDVVGVPRKTLIKDDTRIFCCDLVSAPYKILRESTCIWHLRLLASLVFQSSNWKSHRFSHYFNVHLSFFFLFLPLLSCEVEVVQTPWVLLWTSDLGVLKRHNRKRIKKNSPRENYIHSLFIVSMSVI